MRLPMGDWHGGVRGKRHSRVSDNMVQEHASIRAFVSLSFLRSFLEAII